MCVLWMFKRRLKQNFFEVSDILKNNYFKSYNNHQIYFTIYFFKLYIECNIFFKHFLILLAENGFLIV